MNDDVLRGSKHYPTLCWTYVVDDENDDDCIGAQGAFVRPWLKFMIESCTNHAYLTKQKHYNMENHTNSVTKQQVCKLELQMQYFQSKG